MDTQIQEENSSSKFPGKSHFSSSSFPGRLIGQSTWSSPPFESTSSLVLTAWAMEQGQLDASTLMKNNESSLELCKEAHFAIKPILLNRKEHQDKVVLL